jgi:ElaB/YqjD/DUF883 family membrane-anchored ribosome-binding protein
MKLATNNTRLRSELRHLAQDIEHLLHNMTDATEEHVDTVRSRTRAGLNATRERLGDMGHGTARQLRAVGSRTSGYVRRNPWRVVGVAVAAAYLLGVLVRSRR